MQWYSTTRFNTGERREMPTSFSSTPTRGQGPQGFFPPARGVSRCAPLAAQTS
jgi:hypothetical protein